MKLTSREVTQVKTGLEKILAGEILWQGVGLCCNLNDHLSVDLTECNIGYKVVEKYSRSWEHFSGHHPGFPVDNNHMEGMWEGTNREKRMSLCKHILNELEKEYG